MKEAALKYASRGIHVFPVKRGAKTPLTEHGCKDATTDPALIESWWQEWPAANIGALMGEKSGITALDFDVKDGRPGLRTLESLQERFNINTLTAITPSGGVHLLFRYAGPMLKNSVERLPGLDVRNNNGYVLIAPSVVHRKEYRWTHIVPPMEMPEGLKAMLTRPEPAFTSRSQRTYTGDRKRLMERVRTYVKHVPPAIQGRGGDLNTYQLCCRLVRGFALSDAEALDVLLQWNRVCDPPWTENELVRKIEGARKYGSEPVGARLEVMT